MFYPFIRFVENPQKYPVQGVTKKKSSILTLNSTIQTDNIYQKKKIYIP